MNTRTYDDDALTRAVADARSWRDVLRRLGLSATSAAAIRSVRAHSARLGLDHDHFTGQRRWTESDLAAAVATCRSWTEVQSRLDLAGGSSTAALKGHALRLGLDTTHLRRSGSFGPTTLSLRPDPDRLLRAGAMWAAAWFTLCGFDVSWPLEPCRYDLVALRGTDEVLRIQVKTTRKQAGGSWHVSLATSRRVGRQVYDPDDVDYFFVIDGALRYYLIPIAAVGGRTAASLSAYSQYRLPALGFGPGRREDESRQPEISASASPAGAG